MKKTFNQQGTEEIYKGFEINQGQLFNGEWVYEAANPDLSFYRKTLTELKEAINFYATSRKMPRRSGGQSAGGCLRKSRSGWP